MRVNIDLPVNKHVSLVRQFRTVTGQYCPSSKALHENTFIKKMIVGQFAGAHAHEAIVYIEEAFTRAHATIFFILSLIVKKNKEVYGIIELYCKDSSLKTVMQLSYCLKSALSNKLYLFTFYMSKIVLQLSFYCLDCLEGKGALCL